MRRVVGRFRKSLEVFGEREEKRRTSISTIWETYIA